MVLRIQVDASVVSDVQPNDTPQAFRGLHPVLICAFPQQPTVLHSNGSLQDRDY